MRRIWLPLLLCTALAGCASEPPAPPAQSLFADSLFEAPSQRIRADDVLALNDDMRRYLKGEMATQQRMQGRQAALVQALYRRGDLKLEYDAARTRNAAQAFEARSGNCLSLVLMTAAFAKELGLQIQYQSAITDETWTRSGNLYFRSGHVNITLGRRFIDTGTATDPTRLTIDFLPPEELRGLRVRSIDEATVIAMYMNNRAVETLRDGALDDAYWWAREALLQDPRFTSAYNTLGVVYLRHGNLPQAERVLREALEREPKNTRSMYNLAQVLERSGRGDEALVLQHRLALLEPYPPFHFFDLGMAAMQRGEFGAAREFFAREVARADYHPEFHFWLGLADFRLGRLDEARRELALAMENSGTRREHDLYAAKLAWLKSLRPQ
jgi:Flp pilus assembly protein TadD